MAANRPGEVFFPTSGNCGRHHCPGQFGTSRASPSPFSPPRASSSSREPFPLLDFDRGSLRENFHSAPEASSAASSPPAAPSVPTGLATTGRTALERRLRLYAAAYMLLAVSFLLRATPPPSSNAGADAVTGFLLWVAAVALLLLSFVHQRFQAAAVAAADLAQAALEPLFELLN